MNPRRPPRFSGATVLVFGILTLTSGCTKISPTAKHLPSANTPAPGDAMKDAAAEEPVDVWLVPVVEFPDEETRELVRRLRADLPWLRVRQATAVRRPEGVFLSESDQISGRKALEAFRDVARGLPKTKFNTAFVFLISEDLNLGGAGLRFTFAVNEPNSRMGVVSRARLVLGAGTEEAPRERVRERLYKMVKRQVGELRLGLTRTSDPEDLLYSPLMSLDDLDRIGTEF